MVDRRSELDFESIRQGIKRIQQEEGRDLSVPVNRPVTVVFLPVDQAPRGVTGLVKIKGESGVAPRAATARFAWGAICSICPLIRCKCFPGLPTHWGEVPDEWAR